MLWAVIQCIKGVMGLQKVWGIGNHGGSRILEIEENMRAEGTVIIITGSLAVTVNYN